MSERAGLSRPCGPDYEETTAGDDSFAGMQPVEHFNHAVIAAAAGTYGTQLQGAAPGDNPHARLIAFADDRFLRDRGS
jgi:hypothetical protein